MVDAVVSIFVERLCNILIDEGRAIIEFQDHFEEMKRQLKLMQGFLRDADRLRRKNHTLRAITDDLIELIYDAEDILADCQARKFDLKDSMSNYLTRLSHGDVGFRFRAGKRLREINKKIKEIKDDMSFYLTPALTIHNNVEEFSSDVRRWSSPVFNNNQIVGLEADTNKIMGWLLEATDGLNAIGIVGMGGLGKTTAAQKVFSNKEVEDHFEKRIWVSVSQTFTEEGIMRSILKNLGDASIGADEGELLNKIHQYLLGKSFLIVMDDVWNVNSGWWMHLSDGLPKGSRSSVIITTRNERIAREMGVATERVHRPKFLTKEESWSLFSRIAFAGRTQYSLDSKLKDVGMEIVEKCGGLPLALKAVAGLISFQPCSIAAWRRIVDNFNEELLQNKNSNNNSVVASLQLSYDELPSLLKPCILCLSIFPEDCIIMKDQLIRWWIAEGFVPMRRGRSLVESSEECFAGLLNRCLIEPVDKSFSGTVFSFKVHDMVRELLIEVGEEEAFCKTKDTLYRRLGLAINIDKKHLELNLKLRALVSTTNMRGANMVKSTITKNFRSCRNVRVLDLSESIFEIEFMDLLSQIGSLRHLTYLSLRNTHPLTDIPQSVKKLTNLRILDLSFCHTLQTLPSSILDLRNLVVLDLSSCGSFKYFPKGLRKLSALQVLRGFRPSRASYTDGCQFSELQFLVELRILELQITRAEEITDTEMDALLCLQQLRNLTITCFDSHGDDLVRKLDLLSIPGQLEELYLKYLPGESTPKWLNPNALPQLQYLSIIHGNFCQLNPRFWGTDNCVWRLDGLMLESLPDLEEEWWKVKQAIPSLRILEVSWCPKLESFPIDNIGFKGGIWRKEE